MVDRTTSADPAGWESEGFAAIGEVCRYLSLSRSKVYRLMDEGKLPFARIGRARRVPWSALKEFARLAMVPEK